MIWLAISGSALATYLARAFAFAVTFPTTPPRRVARYLEALPTAIIAALVGPAVLVPNGAPTHGPELVAAAAVLAVVAWRRNLLVGVFVGVATVALVRLVLTA